MMYCQQQFSTSSHVGSIIGFPAIKESSESCVGWNNCWNARNADKKTSFLAVQEIEGVETILFNSIQHDKFGTDVLTLTQNQPLLKKQAPQINTISRQKRYNENWRKIIKSRDPGFNKPSTINLYFLANIMQCSCLFGSIMKSLSLVQNMCYQQ